jgi:hypothetical protein
MENSIISNFRNELLFLNTEKFFVLSLWKLTLGYGITETKSPTYLHPIFFLGEFGAQKLRSL